MLYTRRDVGKIALAAGTASRLFGQFAPKPNSLINGVQIGAITYSFRALPSNAYLVLGYCLDCGISAIELMGEVPEQFAGIPGGGRGRGGFGGGGGGGRALRGGPPGGGPPGGTPPGGGGGDAQGTAAGGQGRGRGGGGGGRAPLTPEQQAAVQKAAEETKNWRLSVSMDRYKALCKMYNDAGVSIYAYKPNLSMAMSDQEYDYFWNVAEALGANHITTELPGDNAADFLQRLAEFAAKRKRRIAFHTHGQGGESGFTKALAASPYTALNIDVGHYYGVNGVSPVPVVEKYHDRIASLHLKDRKGPSSAAEGQGQGPGGGGPNMPWGQGETPLKEILQLMKTQKYNFPTSIEYEYNTPEGSDVLTEVKKCVQYCKDALA